MSPRAEPVDEVTRLRAIDLEYRTTLRVLAVVIERLLAHEPGLTIAINEQALVDSPDLLATRDAAHRVILLSTAR